MRAVLVAIVLLVVLSLPALADVTGEASAIIEAMVTTLDREGALEIDGQNIIAHRLVAKFYTDQGFAPVWTDPATVGAMLESVENIRNDGLRPEDYHGPALAALGADLPGDAHTLAQRDLLLSDALVAILYHLAFGKADPSRLDADWNLNSLYGELDPTSVDVQNEVGAFVRASLAKGDIEGILEQARPQVYLYGNLRTGLAFYHELAAAGGWGEVSEGPTLRQGDDDPRVPSIRRRLAVTRDFTGNDLTSTVIDEDLVAGIIRFQARHGLDDDGVVGKGTLAAMNVPVEDRIRMIEVNLDRARWVLQLEVGDDLILVNIAAFEVSLIRNRQIHWQSRVQVGKPFTKTPVFADEILYLEINPTWTVPASITNTSTLAKVKKDPGYLAANHMVLLDSQGRKVSPESVDWSTKTRMPYTVRQEPGTHNALGQVKFIFPNPHAVYLHDTPSRQKFARSNRAFSHGCIRVENPFDLATLLLDDQPKWTRAKIDEVLASEKQTRVNLSQPLPVMLLYWTAFSEEPGVVDFRQDIYKRDAAVLKALKGPMVAHSRHKR